MIVGRPMDTWRAHMPKGMFLKSEPYGSTFSSAVSGYEIATYAKLHGLDDYVDRIGPLSIKRFIGYADWFTSQLVPDVRDLTVESVTAVDGGFSVEFAEESPVLARQVIVATGLLPYLRMPGELSGLPADLVTHTSAHTRFDAFRGRRVAVLGGGQSALQTGALLHEAGADVQVIVRKPSRSPGTTGLKRARGDSLASSIPRRSCARGGGAPSTTRRTRGGCYPIPSRSTRRSPPSGPWAPGGCARASRAWSTS